MDFALYARVLWRFRILVAAGLVLALLLSWLTVSGKKPVYQAQSSLLLTHPSFPASGAYTQTAAVPSSLTDTANLYVQFANGDAVQALIAGRTNIKGTVSAAPVYMTNPAAYVNQLPMIYIIGSSDTPAHARTLASVGTKAFEDYMAQQQRLAHVTPSIEVLMKEITRPRTVVATGGAKKTLPVVVFLTVMMAVVGVAFVLENLRPRVRTIAPVDRQPAQREVVQRHARHQ